MWRPVEAGGDVFPKLASLDFGFRLNAILSSRRFPSLLALPALT